MENIERKPEIEITRQMVIDARSYVPLKEKNKWLEATFDGPIDTIHISDANGPLPDMYSLNTDKKNRYLMGAFALLYFETPYKHDGEDFYLMSEEDYDKWAGSHVINQLKRFMRDAELRDKVYDILYDFQELEKRFAASINSNLTVRNDAVVRQSQYSATMMAELPKVVESLKQLQNNRNFGGADVDDGK